MIADTPPNRRENELHKGINRHEQANLQLITTKLSSKKSIQWNDHSKADEINKYGEEDDRKLLSH